MADIYYLNSQYWLVLSSSTIFGEVFYLARKLCKKFVEDSYAGTLSCYIVQARESTYYLSPVHVFLDEETLQIEKPVDSLPCKIKDSILADFYKDERLRIHVSKLLLEKICTKTKDLNTIMLFKKAEAAFWNNHF